MNNDLSKISTEDLQKELLRRKSILEDKAQDLSSVPIEHLISEWAKRSEDLEKTTAETLKIIQDYQKEKTPIDTSEQEIIFNAIKTPDGTVLTSRHRHDFVTHEDTKTGKVYGVDGGSDYLRRIGDVHSDCEDLSITKNAPFEVVRENFHWGSYGKNGDKQKSMKKLKEVSNEHLQAILDNVNFPVGSHFKKFFEQEQKFRKENNIFVEGY